MSKVVAIDIGGTKTLGALIDEKANKLKEIRVDTNPHLGPENLIHSLYKTIDRLIEGEEVRCIGIGSAGRININDGTVFFASDNIPGWTNTPIKKIIEYKFGIETVVENDCRVTGLGEEWMGSLKGISSYVCLALGTGVGAAVKIEGNMLHGVHHSAGELGHMIIHPHGRSCNCGLNGCLEQYCSGTALVKIYNERSKLKISSGYQFFDLVKISDETAVQVLNEFVDNLAITIISLYNIYDPKLVVIGGGLIDTKKYWWVDLNEKIQNSPINNLFKPEIAPATLGSKAAIYGAAYLALKRIGEA